MPTIKDIAKLAGVGQGTVSNVLNKKGNVSSEKIGLVEKAAKELGYNTNLQAQRLRQGASTKHVAIILPNIETEIYKTFYNTLSTLLKGNGYAISLHLSNNLHDAENGCLVNALSYRPEFIICISCFANLNQIYTTEVPIIFIDTLPSAYKETYYFFAFDYCSIAQNIKSYCEENKYKSVAFFADIVNIPFDKILLKHLASVLESTSITLEVYSCDHKLISNEAFEIVENTNKFDVILISNDLRAEKVRSIEKMYGYDSSPIISFSPAKIMPANNITCYELNYQKMARHVTDYMMGKAVNFDAQNTFTLSPEGIRFNFTFIKRMSEKHELSFITLDNPTTKVIEHLAHHFYKHSNIKLNIIALPHEELYNALSSASAKHYDLIRMDTVWRNSFENNLCLDMKRALSPGFLSSITDVFSPNIYDAFCQENSELYTLPLDPTTQMLFYRKDLFSDATLKRLYYEKYKKTLAIPTNYDEYNNIAAFFTKAINPASPTQYGTTLTYGSSAVAVCDFLPRLRSMGGDVFNKEGGFSLSSPLTVQALTNYVDSKNYSSPDINFWWGQSLELFANGSCAMLITYINHASTIINSKKSHVINKVGAASLPGNFPLLGGGCIGISSQTKKIDLCMEFFKWIYSDEISNLITLLGGLSPCKSVYENEEIASLFPWLYNIAPHFSQATRHYNNRNYPNFNDYKFERNLGMAVREATMNVTSIQEALQNAQDICIHEFS